MPIRTELRHQGRVAVLWMDNPPVNAMSADLREALGRALDEALSEEGIRAIVLAGAGEFFCCGAEIREFNTPASLREPSLRELIGRIERADKPVVAAVHGAALGGGLELALGCHYRVALAGAKLGLPEVKLGILPGAGGTQRLPRAVGVVRALEMIVEGEPSSAARALADGLLDAVFDDGLAGRAPHTRSSGPTCHWAAACWARAARLRPPIRKPMTGRWRKDGADSGDASRRKPAWRACARPSRAIWKRVWPMSAGVSRNWSRAASRARSGICSSPNGWRCARRRPARRRRG
ncbi:enoyl-CoA hydratase-related protein [Achromobacter sp. DMS1]|uniref:enoyl-CoA hydratase-related protein n=1 Tax=Achromobacter sp. DMS1 TaxID=1688405 RepID=UPI000A8F9E9D